MASCSQERKICLPFHHRPPHPLGEHGIVGEIGVGIVPAGRPRVHGGGHSGPAGAERPQDARSRGAEWGVFPNGVSPPMAMPTLAEMALIADSAGLVLPVGRS